MSREKRELLFTVEKQNEKIKKYETKIRDLVAAYKSLIKEKEALEASVKSLSILKSKETSKSAASTSANVNNENGQTQDFVDPLNAKQLNESTSASNEDLHEQQIAVLTTSLATISAEKSTMEANFQANQKKLMHEKELLENEINALKNKLKLTEKQYQDQMQDLKTQLRTHQYEREKELSDHQIMLRDLQKILADERIARENLEIQLEDAQLKMALKASQPNKSEEYEKKIQVLSTELDEVRNRLKAAEQKASQTPPLLLELQKEMTEMKAQNAATIHQEQKRANEAEERLLNMAQISEERAAGLEAKLAELSEMIGSYDRQRQQDQIAIHRLKERVTQLDIENTALAKAASCISNEIPIQKVEHDSNLDVQALMEKITKLKGLLKLANQRSEKPVDLQEFFQQEALCSQENIHYPCQQELYQLKEEFEQYKRQAQLTLKNKNSKDISNSNKEVDSLKSLVQELQDQLQQQMQEIEETERENKNKIMALQSAIGEMKANHKQQMNVLELDNHCKITELELQLQRQRERSFALLEEKDSEISFLKSQIGIGGLSFLTKSSLSESQEKYFTSKNNDTFDNDANTSLPSIAAELSKAVISEKKEAQILHYVQELARKDVEITNLRKAKHNLESTMRELQLNFIKKEESYVNEIETLKDQVLRFQRNCSREGANLEYLKNVVLSYMLSSSSSSRQHMLNAIAAVLKFSSKELDSVKLYNSTWWWNGKS